MTPSRDQLIAHLSQAEREAGEVCLMLRLAVEELRTNEDDQQVENVVRFAQTRGTRLTVQLLRTLCGMP